MWKMRNKNTEIEIGASFNLLTSASHRSHIYYDISKTFQDYLFNEHFVFLFVIFFFIIIFFCASFFFLLVLSLSLRYRYGTLRPSALFLSLLKNSSEPKCSGVTNNKLKEKWMSYIIFCAVCPLFTRWSFCFKCFCKNGQSTGKPHTQSMWSELNDDLFGAIWINIQSFAFLIFSNKKIQ